MPADRYLHAANALISLAALVTAGGPVAAAGAGVSGLLSWRALRATPAAPDLEKELAAAMEARLARPDVTEDQRALIPQMIEASLPEPATVIAAGLDPDRLIAAMEGALTDREHRQHAGRSLFRATLRPALARLLNDPEFTGTLGPAFMRSVVGQLQGLDETTRATLIETLGARADLRRVEDKIDLLPGQFAALMEDLPNATRTELVAVAHRFEIERAEDLTDTALRRELEERAKDWHALRAQVAAIPETMQQLSNLKGAAQAAFDAGRFEEVETLLARVHEVELEEAAKTADLRAETALLRGRVDQAYHLFASTADSFAPIDPLEPARRRILRYVKPLHDHGRRYGGTGLQRGQDLLTQVLTNDLRHADDLLWAAGMNALAIGYQNLGIRTGGSEGAALLGQAVSAYRAALEVYTRADYPVDWAITQVNLAIAEVSLAQHDSCTDPAPHLRAALAHVEAALEVFDPEHMPYDHQKATDLRDRLRAALDGG